MKRWPRKCLPSSLQATLFHDADQLAERILPLRGEAVLLFEQLLNRCHAGQDGGNSLAEMITGDLLAEQIVIQN